jgi:hypothetical protein
MSLFSIIRTSLFCIVLAANPVLAQDDLKFDDLDSFVSLIQRLASLSDPSETEIILALEGYDFDLTSYSTDPLGKDPANLSFSLRRSFVGMDERDGWTASCTKTGRSTIESHMAALGKSLDDYISDSLEGAPYIDARSELLSARIQCHVSIYSVENIFDPKDATVQLAGIVFNRFVSPQGSKTKFVVENVWLDPNPRYIISILSKIREGNSVWWATEITVGAANIAAFLEVVVLE